MVNVDIQISSLNVKIKSKEYNFFYYIWKTNISSKRFKFKMNKI